MSDSDVMIRVEGLGKKYILRREKIEKYTALRDVLARQIKAAGPMLNPFTLAGQLLRARHSAPKKTPASEEEFWALQDVNFEIRRGDRVGIIGRNGAGKSTLLKILSRITEPSTGRIEILGRVASLLEVGTGFHPELTGRENIYLNGAILGMSRREVRLKFDEIVDFAEIEKFLDTPVKRYSSGMYVRLAFAVAAHLEPDILIVDEVLAVGDARFQEKCLGKLKNVSDGSRTVLFVSHNMEALTRTCESAILLKNGRVSEIGDCKKIVSIYSDGRGIERRGPIVWSSSKDDLNSLSNVTSLGYHIASDDGIPENLFKSGCYFLWVTAEIIKPNPAMILFAAYYNQSGDVVYVSSSQDDESSFLPGSPGLFEFKTVVPVRELNAGIYRLELSCVIHRQGWILAPGHGGYRVFELIDDISMPKLPEIVTNHPFTGASRPGQLGISSPWTIAN